MRHHTIEKNWRERFNFLVLAPPPADFSHIGMHIIYKSLKINSPVKRGKGETEWNHNGSHNQVIGCKYTGVLKGTNICGEKRMKLGTTSLWHSRKSNFTQVQSGTLGALIKCFISF